MNWVVTGATGFLIFFEYVQIRDAFLHRVQGDSPLHFFFRCLQPSQAAKAFLLLRITFSGGRKSESIHSTDTEVFNNDTPLDIKPNL